MHRVFNVKIDRNWKRTFLYSNHAMKSLPWTSLRWQILMHEMQICRCQFLPCKKNLASNTRHAASMFEFKTMINYRFLCISGWCLIVGFNFPLVGVQWFNLWSLRYGVLPVHPGSRWQGHQGLWAVLQIEGGWPAMSVVLWTQSGPLWRPGHVLKTWHAL